MINEFIPLYKKDIWFQEDLKTYEMLLGKTGFRVLETEDCTDKIDIKMRTRLKGIQLEGDPYVDVMGSKAKEIGINYYKVMLKTHYDFLRYGVIIAEKET